MLIYHNQQGFGQFSLQTIIKNFVNDYLLGK